MTDRLRLSRHTTEATAAHCLTCRSPLLTSLGTEGRCNRWYLRKRLKRGIDAQLTPLGDVAHYGEPVARGKVVLARAKINQRAATARAPQ
jgi:hypothetical protein